MVEAAILFKLLPTTILDIDKVFEPLVSRAYGCTFLPTIPLAMLAQDLGMMGCLWIAFDVITHG